MHVQSRRRSRWFRGCPRTRGSRPRTGGGVGGAVQGHRQRFGTAAHDQPTALVPPTPRGAVPRPLASWSSVAFGSRSAPSPWLRTIGSRPWKLICAWTSGGQTTGSDLWPARIPTRGQWRGSHLTVNVTVGHPGLGDSWVLNWGIVPLGGGRRIRGEVDGERHPIESGTVVVRLHG